MQKQKQLSIFANMFKCLNKQIWTCILIIAIGHFNKTMAQGAKDTLYLHNGIVVHGEFKKISVGRIYFDADDIGLFNMKTNSVDYLIATSQLYRINTASKEIIYSKINKGFRPGLLNIISDSIPLELTFQKINSISYFFERDSIKNLEGDVSMGYSYTKSSNIGRLNFSGSLKYMTKKSDFSLIANSISTQSSGNYTRDRENIKFITQTFYSPNFLGLAILNYQRNLELGLSRRFQEGYGMAYDAFSTHEMDGYIGTGLLINQEKSIEGIETDHLELPLILQYYFFKFNNPEITLNLGSNFYFSLTQKGRIRHDSELKIDWEIIGDLSINLTVYNSTDTHPPSPIANKIDYGIVFGLGYSFD